MKILCIGDIVGDKGVDKAVQFIEESKSQFDFIIANIENSNQKSSRGFSEYAFNRLTVAGVSVFTGGNHSFDNKYTYHLYHNKNLLRPCNFPEGTMGQGSCMTQINDGSECSILVINVQLRVFMREMLDCPFRAVDKILSQYKNTSPIVIIDVHGEATAEKLNFGVYFDGRVSGVFGTHTHIQTADERILPRGTGYITDVGMVGAFYSSIGIKFESTLPHFLNQIPVSKEIEERGSYVFSGVVFDVDKATRRCINIKRVNKAI